MILILGSTGYIGQAFCKYLEENNVEFYPLLRKQINYTSYKSMFYYLNANAKLFDTVINCAGYVGKPNVDACEENKEECMIGNVVMPQMLSFICSELMTKFLHVSSGCIYNGYDKIYNEEDEPNFSFVQNNCSFYSGTKALAEKLIHKQTSYICRLRIPFDEFNNPRNYLSKLQNYKKLLNVKNSISHRGDFVKACMHLLEKNAPFGTYNITNTGAVDTEQVCSLLKKYLNLNKDFDFFDSEEEFYRLGAKAPRSNCLLDNSKLLSTGFKIRDTTEALEDSLKKWQ